jgi:hypothetical protein
MNPAVPGLHSEQQLIGFRATLGVKPDPGAVGRRCPAPERYVGPPHRPEEIQKSRRIRCLVVHSRGPDSLVEAK